VNYPILSIIFYEYNENAVSKILNTGIELSETEKEDLLNKAVKHIQKELVKLKRRTCVPKREGN